MPNPSRFCLGGEVAVGMSVVGSATVVNAFRLCYAGRVKLSRDAAFWLVALAVTIVLTVITVLYSR